MLRTFRVVVVRARPSAGEPTDAAVLRALRQSGFEVIVTAPSATAVQAAEAVLQEDADAVVVAATDASDAVDGSVADEIEAALAALGLDDIAVVTARPADDVVARLERLLGGGPAGLGADEDS